MVPIDPWIYTVIKGFEGAGGVLWIINNFSFYSDLDWNPNAIFVQGYRTILTAMIFLILFFVHFVAHKYWTTTVLMLERTSRTGWQRETTWVTRQHDGTCRTVLLGWFCQLTRTSRPGARTGHPGQVEKDKSAMTDVTRSSWQDRDQIHKVPYRIRYSKTSRRTIRLKQLSQKGQERTDRARQPGLDRQSNLIGTVPVP
jgi:hypothetical protein